MFGLNPYSIAAKAGIALALFLAGMWIGHKATSDAWKADMADVERVLRKRYAEDTRAANARADEAERKVEAIRAGTRVVTRYVDREVLQPIYSAECLRPRGVQLVNSALTGAPADPGEPDAAVPATGPAGGRDGGGGAP